MITLCTVHVGHPVNVIRERKKALVISSVKLATLVNFISS